MNSIGQIDYGIEASGLADLGARLYYAESTIAKLKKIVLDDDAIDRSNTALISAVRELVTLAKEYEDYLQEQKFRGGAE